MHQTLKLTITAMGEPGSIFMHPCEPITLHESEIEVDDDFAGEVSEYASAEEATDDAAGALAAMAGPEIFILADTPPLPRSQRDHRRAS